MQSNLANLESFNRKLFTVNSTNNEAFAVADIVSIAATSFWFVLRGRRNGEWLP